MKEFESTGSTSRQEVVKVLTCTYLFRHWTEIAKCSFDLWEKHVNISILKANLVQWNF